MSEARTLAESGIGDQKKCCLCFPRSPNAIRIRGIWERNSLLILKAVRLFAVSFLLLTQKKGCRFNPGYLTRACNGLHAKDGCLLNPIGSGSLSEAKTLAESGTGDRMKCCSLLSLKPNCSSKQVCLCAIVKCTYMVGSDPYLAQFCLGTKKARMAFPGFSAALRDYLPWAGPKNCANLSYSPSYCFLRSSASLICLYCAATSAIGFKPYIKPI